jgi:uncharacterized protein (TIGR03067 family)
MFTAIVLFSLTTAAEPPKEKEQPKEKQFSAEAKKELKKLEGKWLAVKFAYDNKDLEVKDIEVFFTFKGTEVMLAAGDKSEKLVITDLDPTTDPICIDFIEKRTGRPDRTLEGVFKIDGDKLQLAYSLPKDAKNRPTSFEKPGEQVTVWTFKRVKE